MRALPKFRFTIILFAYVLKSGFACSQNIKFKHFAIEEGLSQNTINCTLQDRQGFIWFGTQDGLNCWDGYKFTVYRHDQDDSTTLSHSYVRSIYQDSRGRLWIGTMSGFNLFNPALKIFERYHCVPKNLIEEQLAYNNSVRAITENNLGQILIGTYGGGLHFFNPESKRFEATLNEHSSTQSLSNNRICSLFKDKQGLIWIGTEGGGIDILNSNKERTEHFRNDPNDATSLSNNRVYAFHQDHNGQLWIGTVGGLNRFIPETNSFERFEHELKNPYSLSNNTVFSILHDYKGRLWVGTYDGLNLLNLSTKKFQVFRNHPGEVRSISDNHVNSIFETKAGQLIVGTYGGGINLLDGRAEQFITFSNEPGNPTSLSSNTVWSIHKDRNGRIWIGTNKGLNLFNPQKSTFENYGETAGWPPLLSHSSIMAIAEDEKGNLWVGTSHDGLLVINTAKKTFEQYQHVSNEVSSLPSNRINFIYSDIAGRIWVAADIGLILFNSNGRTFELFKKDENGIHPTDHNITNFIYEDRKGRLWVGTNGGLSYFNLHTKTFSNYVHDPEDSTSLSSNNAYYIHEDRKGRLWIGTETGLNLFIESNHSFMALHHGREFPNDIFYSVVEDDNGRLWSSTNNGLLRFTPAADFAPERGRWGEFREYTFADGIQNNEFNIGASFKSNDGVMYFGGINGFNIFHPDSIYDDRNVPPVAITNLEIFNKPITPGKEYKGFLLPNSITEISQLILSYRESVFTIEFAALSFTNADKNKYAYQLEGFDKDWNYTDAKRRFATYTNLDPGTYTFRVKGSNQDGIWNEKGRTLTVIITPPWWKTWWFRSAMIFSFAWCIILFVKFRTRQIRRTNLLLTETVAQKTKELRDANFTLVEQEKEILAQNKELMAQAAVLEENNKKLEKAKELLEIEIKYLHQTQLFKASIDVQEEERKRIAQNLHDELGATLSIARMHLDQLLEHGEKLDVKAGLERTKTLTETALASMRRISHALMPPHLEKYGLIAAIQDISSQLTSTQKISLELVSPKTSVRWSMPIELGLYRICMEMINNTIKYAEAAHIRIHLLQKEDFILLTYFDNGKGLPKKYNEGLGFKNIAARVNSLGGDFEINKKEQKGFSAVVTLPYTMDSLSTQ